MDVMHRSALLSDDKMYRYQLGRQWRIPDEGEPLKSIMWIMFNPSTADAETDDRTINKIVMFSKRWGFDGLMVGNLFAYRTAYPSELKMAHLRGVDVVGSQNDASIVHMASQCAAIMVAWGTHEFAMPRAVELWKTLAKYPAIKTCMGVTKNGSPRHPLYLAGDTRVQRWTMDIKL